MDSYQGGGGFFAAVIPIILLVFFLIVGWRIFTKAGKPGWAVIIPIYNIIVFLEIVNRPLWWIILMLIPIVNFVVGIILIIDLAKSFGKGVGFAIGMIFLGIIFYPILAFGSASYRKIERA
jgi:hypothetical protein